MASLCARGAGSSDVDALSNDLLLEGEPHSQLANVAILPSRPSTLFRQLARILRAIRPIAWAREDGRVQLVPVQTTAAGATAGVGALPTVDAWGPMGVVDDVTYVTSDAAASPTLTVSVPADEEWLGSGFSGGQLG